MSEETATEEKTDKKDKKEKKKKKEKEVKKINVKSTKANPNAKCDPRTGTRFEPGSARQLAMEIVLRLGKEDKNAKEIREELKSTRKDNGAKFNLDAGYLNFCAASHPEMIEVYSNGVVKIVKEPIIDKEAAKKFEEEKEAKRKKALENREKRKKKSKDKDKKEGDKKKEE